MCPVELPIKMKKIKWYSRKILVENINVFMITTIMMMKRMMTVTKTLIILSI